MTDAEWLTEMNSRTLIQALGDNRPPRKWRLFVIACGEMVSHLFADARFAQVLAVAHSFADERTNNIALGQAFEVGEKIVRDVYTKRTKNGYSTSDIRVVGSYLARNAVAADNKMTFLLAEYAVNILRNTDKNDNADLGDIKIVDARCASILRELFGRPFRPLKWEATWFSTDVVGLARSIVTEQAYERMPILADALMDAGCEEETIIAHCRGAGPHLHGCWVLDRLLGY